MTAGERERRDELRRACDAARRTKEHGHRAIVRTATPTWCGVTATAEYLATTYGVEVRATVRAGVGADGRFHRPNGGGAERSGAP